MRLPLVATAFCLVLAEVSGAAAQDETAPEGQPTHLAFHPKSEFRIKARTAMALLLARNERQVRDFDFADWDRPALRATISVEAASYQAASAAFMPDGESIVTAGRDGLIQLRDCDGKLIAPPLR